MKTYWEINKKDNTAKHANNNDEVLEIEFSLVQGDGYIDLKVVKEIKNTIKNPLDIPKLMSRLGDEYKILHHNDKEAESELPKPIDIAKLLGIKVTELLANIDNTDSDSLSKLRKTNPNKYMIQIKGIICDKLKLSIEELIKYSELRKIIESRDKSIKSE